MFTMVEIDDETIVEQKGQLRTCGVAEGWPDFETLQRARNAEWRCVSTMAYKDVLEVAVLVMEAEMRENRAYFASISIGTVHGEEKPCIMIDIQDAEFWKSFKNLEFVVDNDGEFVKLCGWDDAVVFETGSLDCFGTDEVLKCARKVEMKDYIFGRGAL